MHKRAAITLLTLTLALGACGDEEEQIVKNQNGQSNDEANNTVLNNDVVIDMGDSPDDMRKGPDMSASDMPRSADADMRQVGDMNNPGDMPIADMPSGLISDECPEPMQGVEPPVGCGDNEGMFEECMMDPIASSSFTMALASDGLQTFRTNVRQRFVFNNAVDALNGQRSREVSGSGAQQTERLQTWSSAQPNNWDIYTLRPQLPLPGGAKVSKTTRMLPSALIATPLIPRLARWQLDCWGGDPSPCLAPEGFMPTGQKRLDDQPCQIFRNTNVMDAVVELCMPLSCDRRRFLFPLEISIRSMNTSSVTRFTDMRETQHDASLFKLPTNCQMIQGAPMGLYCDPP